MGRTAIIATLVSVSFSVALAVLLERGFSHHDVSLGPAALLGGAVRDFGAVETSLLAGTVLSCVWGVGRTGRS